MTKTNRWINRVYYRESTKSYDVEMKVCPKCFAEFSYDAETGIGEFNYCPNCGSKNINSINELN